MKTIVLAGLAAALCWGSVSSANAYCSFAGDAQAQADCQQQQLDQARQARDELETIARDRNLLESLNPESRRDPYDLGHMFLDNRQRNAIQDLDSALHR